MTSYQLGYMVALMLAFLLEYPHQKQNRTPRTSVSLDMCNWVKLEEQSRNIQDIDPDQTRTTLANFISTRL